MFFPFDVLQIALLGALTSFRRLAVTPLVLSQAYPFLLGTSSPLSSCNAFSYSHEYFPQNYDRTKQGRRVNSLAFELDFGGNSVRVELSSRNDIPAIARQLASQFSVQFDSLDIEHVLNQSWEAATSTSMVSSPPPYEGPSPRPEERWSSECSIELPSGLVLELGPSTIGENVGLGLFVRLSSTSVNGPVLQTQGSAFCGYGPCRNMTNSLSGLTDYQRQRSFEFILPDSLESYVWYGGKLQRVWDVMKESGATSVLSHRLDRSENGGLSLIYDSSSPCYLVPPENVADPKSLTIQTIGHMCNDLAGGKLMSKEEYDELSHETNLLVLVPRVVVTDKGVLEPVGMPILTLARTILVTNMDAPMEVGLRYGQAYWSVAEPK